MKSVPEQIFIQHEISYLHAIQLLPEDMKFSCWIDLKECFIDHLLFASSICYFECLEHLNTHSIDIFINNITPLHCMILQTASKMSSDE